MFRYSQTFSRESLFIALFYFVLLLSKCQYVLVGSKCGFRRPRQQFSFHAHRSCQVDCAGYNVWTRVGQYSTVRYCLRFLFILFALAYCLRFERNTKQQNVFTYYSKVETFFHFLLIPFYIFSLVWNCFIKNMSIEHFFT